jgi:two-component system chemotaxis sensor kinase CheA
MRDDGLDEIVDEFIAETSEILSVVEEILVKSESEGVTDENIAAVFRGVHTVKGTAAFLEFGHMSSVAHDAEHILSRVRDKSILLSKGRVDLLLEAVDALRAMLAEVESNGRDGTIEYTDLIVRLGKAGEDSFDAVEALKGHVEEKRTEDLSETSASELSLVGEEVESAQAALGAVVSVEMPDEAPPAQSVVAPASASATVKGETEQVSIRVDTGVLDRLIDLVGELVLARNQLVASGSELGTAGQRLNHVVSELQEGIMRTRMQPVATLLTKAPRIARDAANQLQKRVRVVVDAGDTELDRGVLEAVRDPLTHLLRNAVDHGIERPAERVEHGKDPEGVVDVRAWHEGGHVVVEVRDDGRGVDVERVRAKAVERGLIDPAKASLLSMQETHNLLLLPGFSTAEKVTSVSGRGVGMDVVKSNVERIGGSIEVHSTLGEGTAWRLRIPLTLAILPVLIVRVGEYMLAIPSSALREALRAEQQDVERLGERLVLRLRGELLPLVYVSDALDESAAQDTDALRVIVVSDGQVRVGLIVSEIGDPAEIVVKPLGTLLGGVSTVAGATVMGDGRIAYILDVAHIANQAGLGASSTAQTPREDAGLLLESGADVIVGRRADERIAFDVSEVERLERFESSMFEYSAGRCVVQYRGVLLEIDGRSQSGYVVVCRDSRGVLYGVGVDEVEDVADVVVDANGTVVVAGRVAQRYERWS